ncbi:NADH-quinone oxidoreductase subunit C [Desulfovibrio sulfodismutans]|uniref:NADH-quinone oxidoreductase subunit C n=1 Tax=Desulfolutivibrio sulfodismutans TaxID=63561 RepID=A0A7K3NHS2_9BACT|nr:NADH-quinone oxidoreductase subunit C [Desulfolutivibrio sulfodismutans]NDY55754.1 NADH-quinone oxidoreductase subunit C [Desulfolutivibrio sulfodismutans]QLA13373.1 hypothetical protein GD606_14435 [Desulfolutivibrio sulfodismutans DSM 3696]
MDASPITAQGLVALAKEKFAAGYRLLTLSCVDLGEAGLDILYHYDKNLHLENYRLTVPRGETVPSISGVYFAALLVENEIRDQFGVCFDGIVLDFGGTLYLEDEVRTSPFCKFSVSQTKPSEG